MTATNPVCPECGYSAPYIGDHMLHEHGILTDPREAARPQLVAAFDRKHARKRRTAPPSLEDLKIQFAGFEFPVNWDVPADACLPLPPEYRIPVYGDLGKDITRAVRYIACGRSTYIWGLPGCGKDALPHALCAFTRTPSAIYQISPEVDIMAWFFVRAFDATSTRWEEGELLKQLRDGYTTASGRTLPYTIVLSDFDRAGRSQAEAIRLVMDSIQGRIVGPSGQVYQVRPGTRIILTANTMGGGDERGRMTSANVIDGSIINRIERKIQFHSMDWRDEEVIIRAKFPRFVQKCEDLLPAIGACVKAIRKAVEDQELYGEFSHRDLCAWIGDADDILKYTKKVPSDLLQQAFQTYADGLPDGDARLAAQRLIDPHLQGGAVPRGDTSGIGSSELSV